MKTTSLISCIVCLIWCSCGSKTDQTTNVSDNQEADTVQTESAAEPSPSTQTLVLKWKSVSMDEYGRTYEFEDLNSNIIRVDYLNIPNFSDAENDYFTTTPVEGTPFSTFELKRGVTDKWFDVTLVTSQEESMAGDGIMADVLTITAIKPH